VFKKISDVTKTYSYINLQVLVQLCSITNQNFKFPLLEIGNFSENLHCRIPQEKLYRILKLVNFRISFMYKTLLIFFH